MKFYINYDKTSKKCNKIVKIFFKTLGKISK